jgi:hypothetical protein
MTGYEACYYPLRQLCTIATQEEHLVLVSAYLLARVGYMGI